ncbi:MAG: hypothetical protein Q9Q13_06825 [Acidobacteriota bacterium]|nr:hypothetical protein [Acidobacteriota bacterium]
MTECTSPDLVRTGQFAVPAPFGGQVDDDRGGTHLPHHLFGDQHRGLLAGNGRGRDHDLALGDDPGHHLALPAVEFFTEFLGVTALVFGGGGLQLQLDELPTEALHLFLDRGADIVGMDHCAQALGGGDRLESGDAGADDEDMGRREGAGRGHFHGEQPGQGVGRQQHRLVARHHRLGREDVHALGAGDAGEEFEAEERDAAAGEGLDPFGMRQRVGQADDDLTRVHQLQVLVTGRRIRTRRADLEDHLAVGEELRPVFDDGGAFFGVVLVRVAGRHAGAAFHADLDARLEQGRQHSGNESHALFSRAGFLGYSSFHRGSFLGPGGPC